ncbi:MAG: flavodoxin family protein [Thermodesulfobacteriota bacterium]
MKIVAVLGSPRPQGNSNTLARAFLKAAEERGAETREFLLNQMNFQGCQACMACKTKSETCILEDDLVQVFETLREADVLVLASPVYFGDLSSQLKAFFDRTYSCINPDFSCRLPAGKTAVMILTQANPDPKEFDDIFPRYERWLKLYGCNPIRLLRATGVREPGEVMQQPALMDLAAALARELVAR